VRRTFSYQFDCMPIVPVCLRPFDDSKNSVLSA
jgi:hypothetical protein